MLLNAREEGPGPLTALLLHGMMGSAESWWRVSELLAFRGYRVIAVDLPGHGSSPRDPGLTIPRAADAVADTLAARGIEEVSVAIGHSFGGLVLAAGAARIRPGLAVYVDSPFTSRGGGVRSDVVAEYERARTSRTVGRLRAERPQYGEHDCVVEARAAAVFDPATGAAVAAADGGSWPPERGSIVVRPEPSRYVTTEQAGALEASGVVVRSIPGASHSVWYGHFDEFVAALPEVFGSGPPPSPRG